MDSHPPHPKNKRRHARYRVSTTSACEITFDESTSPVELVNLSSSGLCIYTSRRIPSSEDIIVSIADQEFRAQRVWMIPESFEPLRYRTGLVRVDETLDLVKAATQVGHVTLQGLGT